MAVVGIAARYLKPMWNGFLRPTFNRYAHLAFGEGCEIVGKTLKPAFKANGLNGFCGAVKTAFKEIPATGGLDIFKNMWSKMLAPSTWKASWAEAAAAGKGFWGKLGSTLGKRIPILGNALVVGFEVPNIYRAFTHKDGGVGTGIVETAKAAGKLGAFMGGMAIGQACIPIPIVGGLIGGIIGGIIGDKILGKSFTEKQEEKKQQEQMFAQGAGSYNPFGMQGGVSPQAQGVTTNPVYQQQPQNYKSLQQMYNEYMAIQAAMGNAPVAGGRFSAAY